MCMECLCIIGADHYISRGGWVISKNISCTEKNCWIKNCTRGALGENKSSKCFLLSRSCAWLKKNTCTSYKKKITHNLKVRKMPSKNYGPFTLHIKLNLHTSHTEEIINIILCLQSLLPRGKQPNLLREKHFQVNHTLKEAIETIPNSIYLDSDPGFVRSDGIISHEDMFDYLHLTRKGYKKFCQHIHHVIVKFLKYWAEVLKDAKGMKWIVDQLFLRHREANNEGPFCCHPTGGKVQIPNPRSGDSCVFVQWNPNTRPFYKCPDIFGYLGISGIFRNIHSFFGLALCFPCYFLDTILCFMPETIHFSDFPLTKCIPNH